MNCKNAKRIMLQYLDGDLGQAEALGVKAHLSVCDDCNQAFESAKRIYGIISNDKVDFTFDSGLSARVIDRIKNTAEHHNAFLRPQRYAIVASLSAAAVFAGIILGASFYTVNSSIASQSSDDPIALLADELLPLSSNNIYDFQVDEIDNNK